MTLTDELEPRDRSRKVQLEITYDELQDMNPNPTDLFIIDSFYTSDRISDKLMALAHIALLIERNKDETSNNR